MVEAHTLYVCRPRDTDYGLYFSCQIAFLRYKLMMSCGLSFYVRYIEINDLLVQSDQRRNNKIVF